MCWTRCSAITLGRVAQAGARDQGKGTASELGNTHCAMTGQENTEAATKK